MKNGYDFNFTEDGGSMRCRLNGKVLRFIEAGGAFGIKLKINNPPKCEPRPPLFNRPATAQATGIDYMQ